MIVVQYKPQPGKVDHNEELVRAVFAELAATNPEGIRYATLRLNDGSFLHIADVAADPNPLSNVAAFGRFQEGIAERCEPGKEPNAQPVAVIGNYRLLHEGS
jgi:hypothetical protein